MHNLSKAAITLASALLLGLALRANRQRHSPRSTAAAALPLHDLDPDTADAIRRIHRRLINEN